MPAATMQGKEMKVGLHAKRWYHVEDLTTYRKVYGSDEVLPAHCCLLPPTVNRGNLERAARDVQHQKAKSLRKVKTSVNVVIAANRLASRSSQKDKIDHHKRRLRYVYTEHRWYRNVFLTAIVCIVAVLVWSREKASVGGRFQIDLREVNITRPLDPALDEQHLILQVQGCAITWTPHWFSNCSRTNNDRIDGKALQWTLFDEQWWTGAATCEQYKDQYFAPWWAGWYYMPVGNLTSWWYADFWGEHVPCSFCLGVSWRMGTDMVWSKVGNVVHIHPEHQPHNPDTFSAPSYCHISIPHPPPKSLTLIVNGPHAFKTKIFAADHKETSNPRNVQVVAANEKAPVLVDMHGVHLDSFELGGSSVDASIPCAIGRVQMTNVTLSYANVLIDRGYADISTFDDTVVSFAPDAPSVCVVGATVGAAQGASVVLAQKRFRGHEMEAALERLPLQLSIESLLQSSVVSKLLNTCLGRKPPAICSDVQSAYTAITGSPLQRFYVRVNHGDASVNVWAVATDFHWFDVYDRFTPSKPNVTAPRKIQFDDVELRTVNAFADDHTVDIVDVRVSGPGYLTMDTAQLLTTSSNGFLADLVNSHDLPMRSGPWGFTRRSPLFWHASLVELAAFSAGAMAPEKVNLDLTMRHGFCPTFHKRNVRCISDFTTAPNVSSQNQNIAACTSSFEDRLLERVHRYSCEPAWGTGWYVVLFFISPAFYCEPPYSSSAPHYLHQHFSIDADVYSLARQQGLVDALKDPIRMEWGLQWSTHEWGFFRYDEGTGKSSIETTQNVKLMSDTMVGILWFGSVIIVALVNWLAKRLGRDSFAYWKADMLLIDEQLREFIGKAVPAMEAERMEVGKGQSWIHFLPCKGCGNVPSNREEELQKRSRQFKPIKTRDLVSHKFVSQLEKFLYRQYIQNNINGKPGYCTGSNYELCCTPSGWGTWNIPGWLCCGCCGKRCYGDETKEDHVAVNIIVGQDTREEFEFLLTDQEIDIADQALTSHTHTFDLPASEIVICLHRLRLLTTYAGTAHALEVIVPSLLPWSEQPSVPEALYFQGTHRKHNELKLVTLQALVALSGPLIGVLTVTNTCFYWSRYQFDLTTLWIHYVNYLCALVVPLCTMYFLQYNMMSTGFNQRGFRSGEFFFMRHWDSKHLTRSDFRQLVFNLRCQHWIVRSYHSFFRFIILWAAIAVVVCAQIVMLGMFVDPSRCLPLATAVFGLVANAVSLRRDLLDWYIRLETEIQDAMEVINVIAKRDRSQADLERAERAFTEGVSAGNRATEAATAFEMSEMKIRQVIAGENFDLLRKFQRMRVTQEEVSEVLRRVGVTKSRLVTFVVSATLTLALISSFILIGLLVCTGGSSDSSSGIAAVLIAGSAIGVNKSNTRSSNDQEFQALKEKIMRLYWDIKNEVKLDHFTFDVDGNASSILRDARAHYKRLKAETRHIAVTASAGKLPQKSAKEDEIVAAAQLTELTPALDNMPVASSGESEDMVDEFDEFMLPGSLSQGQNDPKHK